LVMVVAGGVAAPGATGLSGEFGGGDVVVAEGLGDDGGGGVEEVLADRCGPARGGGDAEVVDQGHEGLGAQWLTGASSGEQPA
jgi:hypothetical protein